MKSSLLDKEVLCAYDIRAIQKYKFRSSNNRDIIGSELILKILTNALSYALNMTLNSDEYSIFSMDIPDSVPHINDVPYFYNDNIKAQVVDIGAGNAFVLYRTGSICQAVTRILKRYFLEHTYSLQFASAVTEKTDDMNNDWNSLYEELDRIKNSAPFSEVLGSLPIVMKEEISALPVTGFDKLTGEALSTETLLKRASADSVSAHGNNMNIEKQAFIHMDGNNMGITIAKILSSKHDYISEIMLRRRISESIHNKITEALAKAEEFLQDRMTHDGISFQENYCGLFGGDDVNVTCHADYAMDFVECFVREISRTPMWEDEAAGVMYLTICAGIGYAEGIKDFGLGLRLAEQCCGNAKKEAKKPENLINGAPGNWVDFQISNDKYINDVDAERETSYKISPSRYLCLRPYCFDEARKNTPSYYGKLQEYIRVFSEVIKSTSIRKEFRDAYILNPEMVDVLLLKYRDILGGSLEVLGGPYVSVSGREGLYAAWYDALELITRR